ncbi:MAG: SlyX protein [endosymbiont of Galathealinum brachiosum]|uniref:SlyX protein n=1 Tax=endosymbiont of Galathealinum brachiosum TaxID=2200906 RepID=A0A370DHR7_9GAMM|nr:MAG: SlyX protein [endosymbiont of Galathealinum brachiosum]
MWRPVIVNESNVTLIEEKLIDLEIRLTHQEDHILSLDKIIYEQDKLLTALLEKVKQMDEKLKSTGENNILSTDEETPPPHY